MTDRLTEIKVAIEAAFNRVRAPPTNKLDELQRAVDLLASMALAAPSTAPSRVLLRSFSVVGHATSLRELDDIASAIDRLVKAGESLHRPAIVALADQNIAPRRLRDIIAALAEIAPQIRRAKARVPPNPAVGARGRPRNNRAIVTARVIIDAYGRIFGSDPRLPAHAAGGMPGLLALTTAIFKIIGIKAQPAAALKTAIDEITVWPPAQ